jgi:aromatic ring-opening dioxygenase LigB subunit
VPLVFAAIAPHGDLAIPEACTPEHRDLAAATQSGMRELERRARAATPNLVIILTPHNIHVTGAMAAIISARIAGSLPEAPEPVALDCEVDRSTALALVDALLGEGVPAVGVSFGGNAAEEAVMPMDWGTLVPLWYLGGRWEPQPPVVVAAPARDLSGPTHVTAGWVLGRLAANSERRIALIASADQSHTHDPAGPYGGHPAAKAFDQLVVDAIEANDLDRLLDVPDQLLQDAKPDSWWQLLMLHGALGREWQAELLSYEAPTYYGMLCAAFSPAVIVAGALQREA